MRITKRTLSIVIGLLFIQLVIRAHNITAMPVFTDEYSHIRRAAVIFDFDRHPAIESHGKFLFYFLPGIFDLKQGETALHLARTSVALTSLLTSALIFLICRRFADERAGLVGVAFYTLVPFAFFFERTALADPTAGLVATACVWMAIRFAQKPTRSSAIWLGVFMALTIAAKLTMAFVVAIPAVTILVLGNYRSWTELSQRYGRLSMLVNLTVVVVWLPVLIPSGIYTLQTNGKKNYILYDNHLVGVSAAPLTLTEKLEELQEKAVLLVTTPMTLLIIVILGIACFLIPRRMSIILTWLILAWFPTFFIIVSGSFQSRYLMSGLPAVAVLFGISGILCLDWLLRERKRYGLPIMAGAIVIWAVGFALPFARTVWSEPANLDLPAQDEKDYIGGWYNGYGLEDAVRYLENTSEPQSETNYTVLATKYCLPPIYGFKRVDYVCERHLIPDDSGELTWQDLVISPLEAGIPTYIVTDIQENLEAYQYYDDVQWEHLETFVKPRSGIRLDVWRLELASN